MTSALEFVAGEPEMMEQMEDEDPARPGRRGRGHRGRRALPLLARPGQYVTGKMLEVDGGIQEPNLDLGLPDLQSAT